ncbi:MAG: type IV toxin-antitoxin system AbiEi family antitoxin [Nanoarchaeota archaeon]|mgnify:FL=1
MIINKTTQDIIRVLLNEKDKKIGLRELAGKAKVSLGTAVKIVGALESTGYLEKKRGIKVISWENLLKSWSYTVSIKENKKVEFLAAERPQYLIKKISSLLRKESYAFTLFSATEIIVPYVAPDKTHLYILEDDEKKIAENFLKQGIMHAEQGNIICYLVGQNHFYGCKEIRGAKIISLPQLYVDLVSYGGRGEEAAEMVLKLMRSKNV